MVFPGSLDYYEALKDGLITDREAYVADIPARLNISQMNDRNLEMLGFQVWVHQNTLLNLAPLSSFKLSDIQVEGRDSTYDILWNCPRCDNQNDYMGVILPTDHSHSLRLTCRTCLSRWDIKNNAYNSHTNINSAASSTSFRRYRKLVVALIEKIKRREYRDITNKVLALALSFIPSRLRMGKMYHQVTPPEHVLRSFGAAVGRDPFNPEKHNDFADALANVSAFGAARMHYQQALALKPGDERASSGNTYIDGPELNDEQRATYFVSWSDDLPPARRERAEAFHVMTHIKSHA
jgi:hypothetical protein